MDQPQPVAWVLSIPAHVVVAHILGTGQCHLLSCFQDLEFWVLSDISIHQTYGEGQEADTAATMERLRLGPSNFHPWKGHCPGLTCLQEIKSHTAQEANTHGRGRADRGVF